MIKTSEEIISSYMKHSLNEENEFSKKKWYSEEYVESLKKDKTNLFYKDSVLLGNVRVLGLGTLRLSNDYYICKFDLRYLMKAIKILEEFNEDEISFAFCDDKPLGMGIYNKAKGEVTGVVLAPRGEDDS